MSGHRICSADVMDTKRLIASIHRGARRLRVKSPADAPLDAGVHDFAAIGGRNFKLEPLRLPYSCNGNLTARHTYPARSAAVRQAPRRPCGLTARRQEPKKLPRSKPHRWARPR